MRHVHLNHFETGLQRPARRSGEVRDQRLDLPGG